MKLLIIATLLALLGTSLSCAPATTQNTPRISDRTADFDQGAAAARSEATTQLYYLYVFGIVDPPNPDAETGLPQHAIGCSAYPQLQAFVDGHNRTVRAMIKTRFTGSTPVSVDNAAERK